MVAGTAAGWAEELLAPQRLKESGFLNGERVRRTWQEYLSGRFNWGLQLWHVLMFLAWQNSPAV